MIVVRFRKDNMIEERYLNELIREYESGVSANKISIREGINIATLIYNLRKMNVTIRSSSEGVDKYYDSQGRNKIVLSNELREIILGNLLGDGCIRKGKSNIRNSYSHVDKNLEYILWLESKFNDSGIETYHNQSKQKSRCFYFQTNTYDVFSEFRNMFYKNDKRITPKNIELTPIILRQWFISDGTASKQLERVFIAKYSTDDNLLSQLKYLFGDSCAYYPEQGRNTGKYYIPRKYLDSFYSYIGKSPVKCYEYKWKRKDK